MSVNSVSFGSIYVKKLFIKIDIRGVTDPLIDKWILESLANTERSVAPVYYTRHILDGFQQIFSSRSGTGKTE